MTKLIRNSNEVKNFFAKAEEDFETVSCDADPEEPQAAADISALTNDSPGIANNARGRNGGMVTKRIIATSILLIATVAVVVDITKHPAASNNNSVRKLHNLFDDTSAYANLFESNSAIVTKSEINNKAQTECCVNVDADTPHCHATKNCNKKEKECNKCNNMSEDATYEWQTLSFNAQTECCVNVDADPRYCHIDKKCNKKEKECKKCNNKSKDGTYKWQTLSNDPPPPSPPTPPSPTPPPPSPTPPAPTPAVACCVNIASNTCHSDGKCNKKEKNCKKDKCQKEGDSEWKVPIQTNAPTNNPTTSSPTPIPTSVPSGSPTQKPSSAAPSKSPTSSPSASPTSSPTQKPVTSSPSNAPTANPSSAPTQKPSSAAPSKSPTSSPSASPSKSPTSSPSASPTSSPTQKPVTSAPSNAPTANPSSAPTFVDPTVYEYTDTGTTCSAGGDANVQGPAPLADKRNVVVDFWVYGDTPYDYLVNTCLDDNGNPSTCDHCAKSNSDMDEMPYPNTCTFEGEDYKCVRDSIIPFMNSKMDGGDGAFQVHLGDILKGIPSGNSRRCTPASFASRANLFQPATNFLLINGDNESNECKGYNIQKPSDTVRELWRDMFGKYLFTNDFPATFGGGKPDVLRMAGNEEIFSFEYKSVAFFGLDYPSGDTYITENAPEDLNAKFVRETLADDTSCGLKSIVMFSHIAPKSDVDDELHDYFDRCESLPTLSVLGNAHPSTYCLTKKSERLSLTVEAFQSGPLFVSLVRDGKDGGGDYFHVADSDLKDSNSYCPDFA